MKNARTLILMFLLGVSFALSVHADDTAKTIKDACTAVAEKQIHPLKDGEWKRGNKEDLNTSASPDGIKWSYPWGVTLYGMLRLSEVTGDKQFSDFVLQHNRIVAKQYDYLKWRQKVAGSRGKGAIVPEFHNLDSCGSMGSQVLEGILKHGQKPTPDMKAILEEISGYISEKQSRLPDGTLCRLPNDNNPHNETTLWADDLYMSCPFLARFGTYTKDSKYWDDAARQIINFASYLQDSDGLWFHGYFVDQKKHSPYKWGRANGWALVSEVEVLSQLPNNHPDRAKLLDILTKHIEGLKRVQAPSGMWRQVLDQPDLWEETSCTGMFCYGIARAVNRGWIDKSNLAVAEKAFDALKLQVTTEGSVNNICVGTGVRETITYYATRPIKTDDGHGFGPVLLAGSELLAAGEK